LDTFQKRELKERILLSEEVKEWQNAMIVFQKSKIESCSLKYELHLNQRLFIVCGKSYKNTTHENLYLKLFRSMRITGQLRDSLKIKEKLMRLKYPEIAIFFYHDEIFPELYAPIRGARERIR